MYWTETMKVEDERVERPSTFKCVEIPYTLGSAVMDDWTEQTSMSRHVSDSQYRAHPVVSVRFRLPAHKPADEPG